MTQPKFVAELNRFVGIGFVDDPLQGDGTVEHVLHASGNSPRSSRMAGTPKSTTPYCRQISSRIIIARSWTSCRATSGSTWSSWLANAASDCDLRQRGSLRVAGRKVVRSWRAEVVITVHLLHQSEARSTRFQIGSSDRISESASQDPDLNVGRSFGDEKPFVSLEWSPRCIPVDRHSDSRQWIRRFAASSHAWTVLRYPEISSLICRGRFAEPRLSERDSAGLAFSPGLAVADVTMLGCRSMFRR